MLLLLQGELEHRAAKAMYKRTSKKDFVRQMARLERRQTRIRRIHQMTKVSENECPPSTLEAHHHIGVSEARARRFGPFLQSHHGDPAIVVRLFQPEAVIDIRVTIDFLQNFWAKLKMHLFARITATRSHGDDTGSSFPVSSSTAGLDRLFFKKECLYEHNVLRINYTTYDVRRAQDVINPNTDHKDIMFLSLEDTGDSHQYVYARVLGVYHANVIYTGSDSMSCLERRMEFLWVRWFAHTIDEPAQRSWARRRLDSLKLLPVNDENAFGFVDPANVCRAVHIIPNFAKGRQHPDGKGISLCARDSDDWRQYYIAW